MKVKTTSYPLGFAYQNKKKQKVNVVKDVEKLEFLNIVDRYVK